MAITNWTGGENGDEVMSANVVSAFYTKIFREVPYIAYHDGNVNTTYQSRQLIKNGSLLCYVNNELVTSTIEGIDLYKIASATPGYVRLTYKPLNAVYFSDNKAAFSNIGN